jgi:ATP-dependent Lon protease
MGVGKTTLIDRGLAKALGRPFVSVPLSGYDAQYLLGHSYTYEGSTYGQIAANLMKAKVMNPILYFDEIDKLARTPKGEEVVNFFLQLTDPIQSATFQDRYFAGINLDLSRAIFVFSYNDASQISPILRSRIFQITADTFDTKAKLSIVDRHLLSDVGQDLGLTCAGYLTPALIQRLIETYTCEGGVRRLRHILFDIFREINLRLLTGVKVHKPLSWKALSTDYLKHLTPHIPLQRHELDQVGKINGLYACDAGYGGILPIEVRTIPGNKLMEMKFTGKIGPVMMESSKVALAMAWGLLDFPLQRQWLRKKLGFHLHCSQLSVGKEGPSATLALTVLLYSILTDRKIRADVAITGEMDFSGQAMEIGGLKEKMEGAYAAKIRTVLYPTSNQKDIERMSYSGCTILTAPDFAYYPVANIREALDRLLIEPAVAAVVELD